jgi:hypothetical protein
MIGRIALRVRVTPSQTAAVELSRNALHLILSATSRERKPRRSLSNALADFL